MVPVAVSVPDSVTKPVVRMEFDNWAFGKITAKPRRAARQD